MKTLQTFIAIFTLCIFGAATAQFDASSDYNAAIEKSNECLDKSEDADADVKCLRDIITKSEFEAIKAEANTGNSWAQNMTWILYKIGAGVQQDAEKGMPYLRMAAEQGNSSALGNIAAAYASGIGVFEDVKEAYIWAIIGSIKGNDNARETKFEIENNIFLLSDKERKSAKAEARQRLKEINARKAATQ